jgi:ABC-type uncharacterized transport system permease subunit
MSQILTTTFLFGMLASTLSVATPLIIGGLGETVSERAGVLNIGLDGYMLTGALSGFLVSYYSHNAWLGVLGGIGGGLLAAAIAGYLMVYLAVDQIVVGVAMLILALGATSAVYEMVFPTNLSGTSSGSEPAAKSLGTWNIPGLSHLGANAGQIFQQVPLTWLTIALIPLVWAFLYRTKIGLSLRAAGERPWALEAAGGNVLGLRFLGTLIAGGFGGIAGAFLSIGDGQYFFENMTAGRGFIILGVVIFGRRSPVGVTIAALVFAVAESFEIELQAIGVHVAYQLLLMIPYVVTIVVLMRASGRVSTPGALGQPFVPAQRA